MIIPLILAGGSGTRLWPLSRTLYPKQFMRLVGKQTLFQSTLLRLSSLEGVQDPIILCNEDHRFIVAEQLREINILPHEIILEPVGRNTAPAVAVATLRAVEIDNNAILLALPSDHFINDINGFIQTATQGVRFAHQDKLVTFGIVPDEPETGYGYIRRGDELLPDNTDKGPGVWRIDQFVEKPDIKTARSYLSSGDYYWNSGMFVFKAGFMLGELENWSPKIVDTCKRALHKGRKDLDFFRLDEAIFKTCPADSIDYAVMEKTSAGVMVALKSGWSDLGSWEALWQAGSKDQCSNVVSGDVCLEDVHNSFIYSTNRLVTAIGLKNHVVIETKDAIFVSPRDNVQNVKNVVDQLKQDDREETIAHKRVYRPWGSFEDVDASDRFAVRRITVKPKAKLSLQKHMHRAEHWIVVKGTALVTKEDEQYILKEDQSTYIPLGVTHRLENPGKISLEMIEVQSGSYLAEDDIVRLDDVYGRHKI